MSGIGVRRDKAAFPRGCKSHPATAPAGDFGIERLNVADPVDIAADTSAGYRAR